MVCITAISHMRVVVMDAFRIILVVNYAFLIPFVQGTTSILALACIGGDQEIVDLLLKKLERHIETAVAQDKLYEIFEMPFVVSMDFDDFKCAKQIMDVMNKYITSIVSTLR